MSKKIIVLATVSLISLFVSLAAVNFIAEKYFFDKMIFTKSEKFGYSTKLTTYDLLNKGSSQTLDKRIADLRYIVEKETNPDTKVLGTTSNADDEFTVALIGDSFVYGNGVKLEDRIGNQLEEQLDTVRPSRVYSLGLSGDSILDHYAKLLLAEKHLQPDAVVIAMVENDTFLDYPEKYPGGQKLFEELSLACPGQVKKFDYSVIVKDDDVTNLVDYPSWSDEYANFCILKNVVAEMNKRENLFFLSLSHPFDITELEQNGRTESFINLSKMMNKYVSAITETHGKVIIPSKEFVYKPVSPQEGHSSPETNREYAQMIFKELESNPEWKF